MIGREIRWTSCRWNRRSNGQGDPGVTPEAVIYRYLEAANQQPFAAADFVRVLGADADLLGRWLNLLECRADPAALTDVIEALSGEHLRNLAQAQAWAVLPVAGSARLGLDQWQAVLRSAFLAEVLAQQLGLKHPEGIRWKVLLAISGVNLTHDPEMTELSEFRGASAEQLADASPLIKVFAVVDALEMLDEYRAGQLAQRLLGLNAEDFSELVEWAASRCSDLASSLELSVDREADWSNRLWVQQQVGILTELLMSSATLEDLQFAHEFASRSLFLQVPYLLVLDSQQRLVPIVDNAISIRLDSTSSEIARAVREGVELPLTNTAESSVGERQLLRRMGARAATCVPLVANGNPVGALLFLLDEDVDYDFAQSLYAQQLALQLARSAEQPDAELELVKRYRQREEKRLRELVHEANNPLSVVFNYLHILEMQLQHEPTATEQLQMVSTELKRTGEIIQKMRELSPIADLETQAEVVFAEFDLNDLARRVFELHHGYADDHAVDLFSELAQGGVILASDEQRLAQILNNLMRNAIEASSGQSVAVGSEVGVFREGREGVEVYVKDTGPGLSREVLDSLSEPKNSTKGGDHAGLGLHIVHRLVLELQGSIDVRTATGAGTTFTVFLPLKPL